MQRRAISIHFLSTATQMPQIPLCTFINYTYLLYLTERKTRNTRYNIDTTAKQVAMVWACVAKRRQ